MEKKCSKCCEVKPLTEFKTRKLKNSIGYRGECRICSNHRLKLRKRIKDAEIKKNRPTKPLTEKQILIKDNKKRCKTCSVIKDTTDFGPNKRTTDKVNISCRDCERKRLRKFKVDNKDILKKRYEDNREENRRYWREYTQEQYRTNPEFCFKRKVIDHIRGVEKRQVFRDLWDDVKDVYDMYGVTYHLDHKVPREWFKMGTDLEIVNHLDNLQLIDAKYNLTKSNRWSDPIPQSYLELIVPYIDEKRVSELTLTP